MRFNYLIICTAILFTGLFTYHNVKANPCNGEGLGDKAFNTANKCFEKAKKHINPGCPQLIVDASFESENTGKKIRAYLVKDGKCLMAADACIGKGSMMYKPPAPGDTPSSNKTPPGLLITKKYDGSAFNTSTAIDLVGKESDNKKTAQRGVVFHACRKGGNTAGCIGIEGSAFKAFKEAMDGGGNQFSCPVYSYFNQIKDRNDCDIDGYSNYEGGSGKSQNNKRAN